jgi:hypothetical protein
MCTSVIESKPSQPRITYYLPVVHFLSAPWLLGMGFNVAPDLNQRQC